jgi:hypothetical protein
MSAAARGHVNQRSTKDVYNGLDGVEPARVLRTATSLPLDDLVSRGGFAEPFGAEFGVRSSVSKS